MPSRHASLPPTLAPRGLSRTEAAAYIGIGATLFDQLTEAGRMPKPKQIGGRRVWDRLALDTAFAALPDIEGGNADANPWDEAA